MAINQHENPADTDHSAWYVDEHVTRCKRCVMDAKTPDITFDEEGICKFCHMQDKLEALYPLGEIGAARLTAIADTIKKAGRGKKYDCIVGLSGGRDSTYCLYVAKNQLGLRPLAVHFDNGWDSDIAKSNIRKICEKLDVELYTKIADWEESRELTNTTIRAQVPYIDLTDDVGIMRTLYESASREGVKHVLLAHSFREEGITPLKWNYFDGRYNRALIRRFSTIKIRKLKNVDFHNMIWWIFVKGIRVVNITNYYDDRGLHVERLLQEELGCIDTGQHHFDNEIFALVYHYARHKFGFDWRVVELSARVRTGVITRDQALEILRTKPFFENREVVSYCLKKQGWTWEEYEKILRGPNYYFTDYPSWYPLIRLFKYPIKWLARANVLPGQAYEKYFEA
jgi:hypothetical protein